MNIPTIIFLTAVIIHWVAKYCIQASITEAFEYYKQKQVQVIDFSDMINRFPAMHYWTQIKALCILLEVGTILYVIYHIVKT